MTIEKLDEIIAAICENIVPLQDPGVLVHYSPLVHHALMGEAVRRCDPEGRSYRKLLQDEVRPPRMKDTAIGLRQDLQARHIFPDFRGKPPQEHLSSNVPGNPQGAFADEHAEMPWVGGVSTVPDLLRFAEMFRQGGTLEGNRIVSPAMMELATTNWTGDKPNELYKQIAINHGWEPYPAYIGLGLDFAGNRFVRHFTAGHFQAPTHSATMVPAARPFWVDPEWGISVACLTAGVMHPALNIERFQKLNDIIMSAAL